MKQVDFYCNRCKCSMKVSYTLSGDPYALVLKGIMMKCHRCRKVVTLMNFTEGQVVAHADSHGRLYRLIRQIHRWTKSRIGLERKDILIMALMIKETKVSTRDA